MTTDADTLKLLQEILDRLDSKNDLEGNSSNIEFHLAYFEPGEGLTEFTVVGSDQKVYVAKKPIATNADVAAAQVVDDPNGQPAVEVTFKEESAKKLEDVTSQHRDKPLAILVEGKLLCAPTIRDLITSKAMITGRFDRKEVERIAKALNAMP